LKIEEIKISEVEELIPNLLRNKLEVNNSVYVTEVKQIEIEDFKKLPGVGKKCTDQLSEFIKIIDEEPEKIIDLYQSKIPKVLGMKVSESASFVEAFETLLEEFFEVVIKKEPAESIRNKKDIRNIDVLRKFYGLRSNIYERDKIGLRHRINKERVRQIATGNLVNDLKSLLNGEYSIDWNCSFNQELTEIITSYKKDLAGHPILNEVKLEAWLSDNGLDGENIITNNYFKFLLFIWGFSPMNKSRYYFMRQNVFYHDESINSDLFQNIGTRVYKFLLSKVIPIPFDDIVMDVLEEFDVEDEIILLACNEVTEIEKTEDGYYQINFSFLSTTHDYVFRLLHEKQKPLSYNELLHLINKRLVLTSQDLTIESLKQSLKKSEYVMPLGKSGIWSLAVSNTNTDSQLKLILKSLRIKDKPLTVQEITNFIQNEFGRTDVNKRSIASNLRNYKKHFVQIIGKKFILSEVAAKYKSQIVETKKPIKKKAKLKSEIIKDEIKRYLIGHTESTVMLRDITKDILKLNSQFSPMDIYGVISESPDIFRKRVDINGKKQIELVSKAENPINTISSKYKWNELKPILEREFESIFKSSSQPTYNNSLNEAMDAFFKIITIKTPEDCSELKGLADRILPTLYKFYVGAIDRNDKLNYLKQIVTSQESYFKVLLRFLQESDYNYIKTNKKGFGDVLGKLSKIDTRKNRFKDSRTASVFEFGKHFSRAYTNRNIDTHSANDWTEAEIIETKTSCLVIMICAAFEYYDEIMRL
jgi:predicted Zn-ribbon and HTH transcriptional regulator